MNGFKAVANHIPQLRAFSNFLRIAHHSNQPAVAAFIGRFYPGHFYSPIPSLEEVVDRQQELFHSETKHCPGIDLQEPQQLELLNQMAQYYDELPFQDLPNAATRYHYRNDFFSYGDAIVLYSLLRHLQPKQVIEVGSGFSSAVMLDTNARFLNSSIHFTFIEPYPDRLYSLLTPSDRSHCQIIADPVQSVDLAVFESLEAGDILFVDSSHVMKIGSDLTQIMFEVLPRLKSGVIIHFHDIYWKFEYPKEWIFEGRAWNEAYVLRTFLQYNPAFRLLYFNGFMGQFHAEKLQQTMPLFLENSGGSLWIQKV